ncbi:hypothetical protein EMPS_04353 [Entomortierella parvispora]|uniref:Transmembrane protein n=1 Tax=Entomortierella parvispora TaxID=205924 RepID=A0A9P3LVB4_9FUNG|nr:hypothetical protein EMPS_04353 [Entomortierella parvispora]
MDYIRHQWPLLAVVFFSMVDTSEVLIFLRRAAINIKGGKTADIATASIVPILLFQGVYLAIRFQRVSAVMNRSMQATRWAFRLFCLEYGLKMVSSLCLMTLMATDPDSFKDIMEGQQQGAVDLSEISLLRRIMFFSPILVGWGLKRTLDELQEEERAVLQQLQPQEQRRQEDITFRTEEERQQLLRVRSWPRIVVGVLGATVFFECLQWLATFPSDSSKWAIFFTVYVTFTASFAILAIYRKSLSGARVLWRLNAAEAAIDVLDSAWHALFKPEEAPTLIDFIAITLINQGVLWVVKQVIQDLEEKDARVAAYNAQITAAIAEKARLDAAHEEQSRGGPVTL